MKKIAILIALAIASVSSAQAQNAAAPAPNPMRWTVGMGLTLGGDTLATASYTNGTDIDIRAGGLVAFNGGIDYRVTPEFSFQGTIGFHVDDATAKNGDVRFQRFPLELLAYYHPSAQWRIGGGVRYVASPKLSSSGAAYIGNYEFDNAISPVLEAEYMYASNLGFKFRLVKESYDRKNSSQSISANHVGAFANFYF